MSSPLDQEREPASYHTNDHRPNSGLREGDICHAEINEALRFAEKTVIFGQQNRLRDGMLLEQDEKLRRFHAGHDLVKFFYGGVRQLPEYLLDAVLDADISVTLVKDRDMLLYHHVRCHQSFHIGRTRKTIYMPENVLQSAFEKGYDYWAMSEVLIQETWPLLDYLLIVELVRRCQVRLHERYSLGYYFIKDTLRELNKHRRELNETEDNEFMQFFRHYAESFYAWGGEIRERDPYELADAVYDEERERVWASNKIDGIRYAFKFPTYFDLDRDIVHPAARAIAEQLGQSVAPETVEEVIHDIHDAARFKVSRQIKTDALLEQLLEFGAPGLQGLVERLACDAATGQTVITANQYDGYDIVQQLKQQLQTHSTSLPEGLPGSVSNDFNDLLNARYLHYVLEEFHKFKRLPSHDREESLDYLEDLLYKIIGIVRPQLSEPEKKDIVSTSPNAIPSQKIDHWIATAEYLLKDRTADSGDSLVFTVLKKLDLHPLYHSLLRDQAREVSGNVELTFGDDIREQVAQLLQLVPDQPYRCSSDPQAVRARLHQFERLRRKSPDDKQLLTLLAALFIRLDRADNYAELVAYTRALGDGAKSALGEVLQLIHEEDEGRRKIREQAIAVLRQLLDG